jgi:predicted nucleic acid-binding protein
MQSKTVEKIYIDSNVWFSFLSEGQYENKNSIEFNEAESLFNKAEKGNIIILTSNLVILEIVSVIRKKVITNCQFKGRINSQIEAELKQKVTKLIKKFIDLVTRLEKTQRLRIVRVNESLSNVLEKEQEILNKRFGKLHEMYKCFICKSNYSGYSYKGIDHYDIQHAIIAEYAKADKLITFDRSFNYIKDDFKSLNICVLNTRN